MERIICNGFNIINTPNEDPSVITISFTNQVTGEETYVRVMPYMENIANEANPIRGAYFISLMADEGYFISPMPDALRTFLHCLVFPENARTTYGMSIKVLDKVIPDDVDVKLISSYRHTNKGVHDEQH